MICCMLVVAARIWNCYWHILVNNCQVLCFLFRGCCFFNILLIGLCFSTAWRVHPKRLSWKCKVVLKAVFYLSVFPALRYKKHLTNHFPLIPKHLPESSHDPALSPAAAALLSLPNINGDSESSGSHWPLLLSVKSCEEGEWLSCTVCLWTHTAQFKSAPARVLLSTWLGEWAPTENEEQGEPAGDSTISGRAQRNIIVQSREV